MYYLTNVQTIEYDFWCRRELDDVLVLRRNHVGGDGDSNLIEGQKSSRSTFFLALSKEIGLRPIILKLKSMPFKLGINTRERTEKQA